MIEQDYGKIYAIIWLIIFATPFILAICFVSFLVDKQDTTSNKVEIENLNKDNDSLKLEIKNLETIKDAKVIEVSQLDNDSTIKLFYKLVKE